MRSHRPALAAGLLALAAGAGLLAQRGTDLPRPPIVIVGGTLIDGTGGPPRTNETILIVDGRIKAMGPDAFRRAPKGARVLQGTDRWILPGLIDAHVHFFQTGGLDARPDVVPLPGAVPYPQGRGPDSATAAGLPAMAYVCAGVTSVADLGGPSWIFGLRESRALDHASPRIAFSGPLLATL